MKKVLILILTVSLFACSNKEKPKIGFLLKTIDNPFFVSMKDGASNYMLTNHLNDKYDLTFKAGKNHADTKTQSDIINTWIALGYKAICITPASSSSLNSKIQEAKEKGIKIIIVDTKIDNSSIYDAYIGSDNYKGGVLAGEKIFEALGDKTAKIVFFEGVRDHETAIQRKKGFFDYLGKKGVKPVAEYEGKWEKHTAYTKMNSFIASNKEFNAVFASNDNMALGVIEAMKSNNLSFSETIVVGFDAIPDAIKSIKAKELRYTIKQKPGEMGKKAVKLAIDLLEGKKINKDNPIEVEVVE